MTLKLLLTVGIIVAVIGVIGECAVMLTIMTKTKKASKGKQKGTEPSKAMHALVIAFITVLIIGFIGTITAVTIRMMAIKHGAYDDTYMTEPILKTVHSIEKGYKPDDDIIPKETEDLYGKIFIYFRFGCPDCEAIHDALEERGIVGNDSDDIYFLSSRSQMGKNLLDSMDIQLEEVPSILYIKKNPDIIPHTMYILYTKNDKEESILDEDALDRILELQKEGK